VRVDVQTLALLFLGDAQSTSRSAILKEMKATHPPHEHSPTGLAGSRAVPHLLQDRGPTRGLRVTEEEEREGLDSNSHGETAYRM